MVAERTVPFYQSNFVQLMEAQANNEARSQEPWLLDQPPGLITYRREWAADGTLRLERTSATPADGGPPYILNDQLRAARVAGHCAGGNLYLYAAG